MSKNITILVFLGLMIGCAVYLGIQFKELDKQRKDLANDKADIIRQRNALDSQKNILQSQNALSEKIVSKLNIAALPDSLHRLISTYKTTEASIQTNISNPEKKALFFERNGFEALTKNQFDVALTNFTMAEKASPSFHMCYEISRLLKSEAPNFADEAAQKRIKQHIIQKYSWKAPADLLTVIKSQVGS